MRTRRYARTRIIIHVPTYIVSAQRCILIIYYYTLYCDTKIARRTRNAFLYTVLNNLCKTSQKFSDRFFPPVLVSPPEGYTHARMYTSALFSFFFQFFFSFFNFSSVSLRTYRFDAVFIFSPEDRSRGYRTVRSCRFFFIIIIP